MKDAALLEITPVEGLRDFLEFCRLPRKLYAGRRGFAPSLDVERWTLFARRLNPHYKLVDERKWLARRDGKVVGRIAAQVYRNLRPVGASPFQFGALECVEDEEVVAALLRTAEGWLRDKGADVIHGPFSPSINGEVGVLIEGFEAPPTIFMPWHPPGLGTMVEAAGYAKVRDLISYSYTVTKRDHEAGAPLQERAAAREKLVFRSLDMKNLDREIELMHDLFNDAWAGNWGYVPFTLDEFRSLADSLKLIVTQDHGFFAEIDGEPVAFGIVLPNLHDITADLGGRLAPFNWLRLVARWRKGAYKSGRLALFGMRRSLHRSARGGLLLLTLIEELRKRSGKVALDWVEFGWVLEDNVGMRKPIEMGGATIDKIHRIYEKRLSPPIEPR